eukprot:TRINITY_DN2351_c0_g1_i2.p1 TRINITY_DN2351_c0_g1~~TRINITY_DN2351_c0_g1_i2.p1  ORF type:complete len:170 (-),score=20.43 TRINITY_DN2351_c0_g1_i2:197-706(-)
MKENNEPNSLYLQFISSKGWGRKGIATFAVESFLLGAGFGIGLTLLLTSSTHYGIGSFFMILAIFHFTEFIFSAVYHTSNTSIDAFCIPHSKAYSIAMISAVVEYFLESLICPSIKNRYTFWIGFLVVVVGQALRWLAFLTAQHNFTHIIQDQKKDLSMFSSRQAFTAT